MSNPVTRKWEAQIAQRDVADWVAAYRARVLDGMRSIDGFRDVTFLVERDEDPACVTVLTTWDSMDAIRRFAGADAARTVLPDFMAPFSPRYDSQATFHDQVLQETSA